MREIVTIQVGGFANFVGSHFWNFQDELLGLAGDPHGDSAFKNQGLNVDVLYRTGETYQGSLTYTPRLLSLDVPGSLGSMSSKGTLYNQPGCTSSNVTWAGGVSTHVSEPCKNNLFLQRLCEEEEKLDLVNGMDDGKNGFGNGNGITDKDIVESLENSVHFWTDYSKVHYHPQSLYELKGLWMDAQDFNNFGIGTNSWLGGLHGEEINDRLRHFIEECDHIQGIQFLVDDSGGFSGIAAEFLENIADDYTNTPLLLFSVRGPGDYISSRSCKQTVMRKLHDAVSFSKLSSLCKLTVPLGLPNLSTSKASTYLQMGNEKPYHCSAVYASALHAIGLPCRMGPLGSLTDSCNVYGGTDVNGIIQMLAGRARQTSVAILDVAIPTPSLAGKQFEQSLLGRLQPLTPEVMEDVEDLLAVECLTIHGALESGVNQASISRVKDSVLAAYEHAQSKPMFSHLSIAQCPLPIPLSFPSIFGNLIGQHGELLDSPTSAPVSRGSLDVHSIPVAARLRCSSAVLPFLQSRLGNLRRYGIERGAPGTELLRSWGLGKDELEDMGETLFNMVKTLDPDSYVGSDSD